MDLYHSLNREQKKAVQAEGPVVIVAGPGTGKTQTLTARIRYLLSEKKIDPTEILALTFTRKAAAEMKSRLKDIANLPLISTFHGLSYNILSKKEKITLLTENQREEILYKVMKKINGKDPTQKQLKEISLFISSEKSSYSQNKKSEILEVYQNELLSRELWDYEDLLLSLKKQIKKRKTPLFSYILVDEFQDTNALQYELIKSILKTDNLFVIGDPYQSIYGFRGADPHIFEAVLRDFPSVTTITFHENYRSGQQIIDAAETLFVQKRDIKGNKDDPGLLFLLKSLNEYAEAECIVHQISELIGGIDLLQSSDMDNKSRSSIHFSQIAVMYRTHFMKNSLERKLQDSGMPYQVIGEGSPYETPEVSFLIDILVYLETQAVSSLISLIRSPVWDLSLKTQRMINQQREDLSLPINILREKLTDSSDISPQDINTICTIIEFANNLSQKQKNTNFSDVIHKILTNNQLKEFTEKGHSRQKNINQFLSIMYQFVTVNEAVAYLTYLEEREFYDPNAEKITLLTMHASKGLEFETVFICGFEEGSIPLTRDGIDLEEEKRLFYVGLTRAKKQVILTQVQERNKQKTIESPFKAEIQSFVTDMTDPTNELYGKRQEKWKMKKNQMKLF